MNKIRIYIKTHALLGNGSKNIYADIPLSAIYGSNEMFFSTVCIWVRNLVQAWNLLKMHLNLVDLSLQVVQGLFKKSNK